MLVFHLPVCIHRQFRHHHIDQFVSAPLRKSSWGSRFISVCPTVCGLSFHKLSHALPAVMTSVVPLDTKLFRDLMNLVTPVWLYSGCLGFSICHDLSLWPDTFLLILSGAMPASKYKLSFGVGFKHPVIPQQLSFRTESSFFAWMNYSHTGYTYSAME